jgi:hypothetical protein
MSLHVCKNASGVTQSEDQKISLGANPFRRGGGESPSPEEAFIDWAD